MNRWLAKIKDYFDHKNSLVKVKSRKASLTSYLVRFVVFLVIFSIGYYLGVRDFMAIGAVDASRFRQLSLDYVTLGMLKTNLNEEVRQLGIKAAVDVKLQEELRERLLEREVAIQELNDELLFYRHLHESDKLVEGLRVQSFELQKVANTSGRYRYRSIISFLSADTRNSFFEGYYELFLEARQKSTESTESAQASTDIVRVKLTPGRRANYRYKFKLIDTLKGEFDVAEDIQPLRLFFYLKPKSRRVEGIEKIYSFQQLLEDQQRYNN